jgi:hypothetical protein
MQMCVTQPIDRLKKQVLVFSETSPMGDVLSSDPEFFDIRYAAGRMPWDYGGSSEFAEGIP